jgi:monovalent cation/hydrogen antiporter
MHVLEIALLLLLGATVSVAIAPRLRIPLELFMLGGSILVSMLPGASWTSIDADVVFTVFLPPILFFAAYFTSWNDFCRNIQPIVMLAVGLVLCTTGAVALLAHALIPGLPWAAAFLLGAIVSPPDASAATAITKKLGVPRRVVTILEGESLVNDATALVAYRFALAALVQGQFNMHEAWMKFIAVAAGGVIVGWCVAHASLALAQRLHNSSAESLNSFVTAFGSYVLAEHLGVSGVIATVTAGLLFGRMVPELFPAETRIEAQATWKVVILAINGFIFTLIGLQLPRVVAGLWEYSTTYLAVVSAALLAVVIAIRFLWVFVSAALLRRISLSSASSPPPLPSSSLTIISWVGMRGIVSLATALTIPAEVPAGVPFPYRELLVFLAYAVILLTLVLPTASLGMLMRKLGVSGGDEHIREEQSARLSMTNAVVEAFEKRAGLPPVPDEIIERWKRRYRLHLDTLAPTASEQAHSVLNPSDQCNRRLALALIDMERRALAALRRSGSIHDEVFHQLSGELDLEEVRWRTSMKAIAFAS